jgi:hypothetical protein
MNTASILAKNLQALIDAEPGMSEHALSIKSTAPKTSIRRARLNEGAAQIDTVEKVAKAFQLRACDILDPDLIKRLDAGEPLRMGEHKPPVMSEADWKAIPPRTRAFVEELCTLVLAGALQDTDVAWLHDSMQRAARPAPATPPNNTVPGIAGQVLAKQLTAESKDFQPGRTKV